MPRSVYPRFKDGLQVAGLSMQVPHTGKTFYVCNSTVVQPLGIGGSDGNDGLTPERPFSTIDKAINSCTAGRGDTIIVMPGHAETIANATSLVPDVSHVRIVGMGEGEKRPIITFATATTANIPVSGANTEISGLVFKCNIASQVAMITTTATDVHIHHCSFREGTATGLNFITVGAADADSNRLYVHDCDFYMPTAGNGDHAIEVLKDMVNVRLEDLEIDGDFDEGGILIPAGGDAQVNMKIARCNIKNRLTNVAAISISGTDSSGVIQDCLLRTDTLATSLDSGSLAIDNVRWSDETDQVASTPVVAPVDSASNVLGVDDADNLFASTNVTANRDGSVLERLEHLAALVAQGQDLIVVKTFTSSSIPNNTQTAGALTGAASGTLVLKEIILQTDATGVAGPTNIEISTDNAKGLTGAGAPNVTTAVAGLGANKTVNLVNAASEVLPLYLESGKKLYIHGDDAGGSGAGTVDVIMIFSRVSADATIAAA